MARYIKAAAKCNSFFFDIGRDPIGWPQEAAKMEHLFLI
jgi:hypothetical protein